MATQDDDEKLPEGALAEKAAPRRGAPALDVTLTVQPPAQGEGVPLKQGSEGGLDAFPVPGWERYQPLRFLGQGGMGRVFLARDPRLHRQVALKFVRDEGPEVTRRFVAEARAQARVNHERICKVYEVGEVQRKVFISMQFIDGEPLSALARTLPLEQKVLVLRDAALGVHEAHRAGLIHRDLKPSNIMVERDAEGALKTYVMDFGLARDWAASVTVEGTLLGTPQYMAPEQARGEHARLDRRADVYSLGATLYFLLTGQPPLTGSTALEVLHQLATVEPRPPRELERSVPVDLEAIALKCLEKERSARYDSARALAEDLDRFLAGEPVRARTGPGYQLRKRLRKHWRLVAVAASVFLALSGALGWGVLSRREARERERVVRQEADERERLARRFTERVERIESLARYSALARLHDTRGDRKLLRAQMDALTEDIQRSGPGARGPGQYALGRGALALGAVDEARRHLEAAWAQGFQEPRVAYALALVLGQMYRQQLLEAERLRSPEQREARLSDIERVYRAPALRYLRRSQGAEMPAPDYGTALLVFYEGRLDEALALLDKVGTQLPWFHEAPMLRGDILVARATRTWSGGGRDAALADFEAARGAYALATSIAESLPALHRALGELEYAVLLMELYGQGDVRPAYERGLAAVSRALVVAPGDYEAQVLESRFHRRWAEDRGRHGAEVEPLLQKSSLAVRAALASVPERPEARRELGSVLLQGGQSLRERGGDPRELFREALVLLDGLRPEDRDYTAHNQRGLVLKEWAVYEEQVGLPSRDTHGKAIEAYRGAIALEARMPEAWINLGVSYFNRALASTGAERDSDLEQASATLDKARTLNPKQVATWFYAGEVYSVRAERRRDAGEDSRPEMARALESYRQGLAINPKLPALHIGVGMVLRRQAEEAWERGGSSESLLSEAGASYERALAVAPNLLPALNNLGEVHTVRARHLREAGKDPNASVSAAVAAYQRALAEAPQHAQPWSNLGTIEALSAAHSLEKGLDPGLTLARSEAAFQKALKYNPRLGEAWHGLGELRAVKARWNARRGHARAEDFEEADQAFDKARELSPDRHDFRLDFGRFCLDRAAWLARVGGDASLVLARGLSQVEASLAARPGWPSARAHRAGLLLARAEWAQGEEEKLTERSRARQELEEAVSRNPNLAPRWMAERVPGRSSPSR
ncbi:protein kinase domain-containing protein [Corallococcus terminator]